MLYTSIKVREKWDKESLSISSGWKVYSLEKIRGQTYFKRHIW